MKTGKLLTILPLAALFIFSACDKEEDDNNINNPYPTGNGPGIVSIEISNVAGTTNVDETGATQYSNSSGEQFSVTMLRYYVSNFQLLTDTSEYSVADSYFLVDESVQSSTSLELKDIPAGTYKGVRFMIGVDEDRYLAHATNPYTGALDPANNMFWTWSTGFIHFKLEGVSPVSTTTTNQFVYHVGGMSGQYAGQRVVELSFNGDSLVVANGKTAEVHLLADILQLFHTPNDVSIAATNTVMSTNTTSASLADNYADMFTFDHLHN